MISDKLILFGIIILLSLTINFSSFGQLKNISNQADYIIISPSQFVNTLQPFVEWRQSKNLKVKVAELQQIYTGFPDSTKQASIRDFISYALSYWSDPKPLYVLLAGNSEFIPSYKVLSIFANSSYHEHSVSIDEWYSVNKNQSDTKSDVEIGRFPVNDTVELNNIINKTIYFEDSLTFKDYNTDFLFLTDITDSSSFQRQVHRFINSAVPINYSVDTVFAGRDSTIKETREKFFNILNNRTLFLNYYGYGAPYKWSAFNLFTVGDVDSLNTNNLPFISTSAACEQSFDYPNDSSMVRRLLVLGGNGIVASVSSNGLDLLTSGSDFLIDFYKYLFSDPGITIGNAVLRAKLEMEGINASVDAIPRRYTFLGDPALKIPLEKITSVNEISQSLPENYSLAQNYPNPFNPVTKIRYTIPYIGTHRDASVRIIVYNILGRKIATLVNKKQQPGIYEVTFDGNELASGIYFYKITAGNYTDAKKMILINSIKVAGSL